MSDWNGCITETKKKKNKQVMVRIPRTTAERIDRYAGNTHSSRPDFIIDSIRQYIAHVADMASSVIVQMNNLDVSKQAKEVYFVQYMNEQLGTEFDSYRNARGLDQKTQEVSVLISVPVGLQNQITELVRSTGLFSGNQEFIKVSVHYMFRKMSETMDRMDIVDRFQTVQDDEKALEEELELIKKELRVG